MRPTGQWLMWCRVSPGREDPRPDDRTSSRGAVLAPQEAGFRPSNGQLLGGVAIAHRAGGSLPRQPIVRRGAILAPQGAGFRPSNGQLLGVWLARTGREDPRPDNQLCVGARSSRPRG